MTGVKCVVLVVVLNFLLSLAKGDDEVSCALMGSCILLCSFQAGKGLALNWTQVTTRNTPVHSHYKNQDQFAHQGQQFRGRTSLFKDQISGGNASLQLTGVKIQDEGRYQCYTSTITGKAEKSFIILKVDDCSTNVGAIVGEVIGAIVVFAVIVGLVYSRRSMECSELSLSFDC